MWWSNKCRNGGIYNYFGIKALPKLLKDTNIELDKAINGKDSINKIRDIYLLYYDEGKKDDEYIYKI